MSFKLDHILIGAGRSGTTTLFDYLQQHPQIASSIIKEVIYFSIEEHYVKGANHLSSFFNEKHPHQIYSTSDTYLHINEIAAQRIQQHNPDCKISMILREPGARAFSSYQYSKNNGHDTSEKSFLETLHQEKEIIAHQDIVSQNNHCHFYSSLYHHHLKKWEALFGRQQLFICTTKELKENPSALMQRFFEFLELDAFDIAPLTAKNKAATAKNKALHQFLINRDHPIRKVIRKPLQVPLVKKAILKSGVADRLKTMNMKETKYDDMTPEERSFCSNYFAQDLALLERDYNIRFTSAE